MKLLKLFIAVVIFSSMAAPASAANSGTINFMGRVVSGTCSVSSGSSTLNVTLGDVLASKLLTKDATAGEKDFQINLEKCGLAGSKTVKVKFEGLGENNLLVNTSGDISKAKNVGIGIYENDGSTQITKAGFSKPLNVGLNQTGELKFKAKYVATADAAAVGGVVSVSTTFTLHYN
ncbi:fimbrial protein [Xenorhabdus koppenhoeferi]|uniref:Major type 1 subunit fimbrin (Pilin) n=1 Tax=Xenorhabdus koppenhoeferi TaxID=351659 RepID=A0A1I7EYK4_9GAMM|nr:fimbrial protein [Xenorhabdus koppenhoeferi]SFU28974.1 major type 1 subunit fimbrin (pilin) [Xenorhabdus koppenhoeferi]